MVTSDDGYWQFVNGAWVATELQLSSFATMADTAAEGTGQLAEGPALATTAQDTPLAWRTPQSSGESSFNKQEHVAREPSCARLTLRIPQYLLERTIVGWEGLSLACSRCQKKIYR